MSNYHTDGEIIGERYCRKCDEDVLVELDTTSYSDANVARCCGCGEEMEVDLADYQEELSYWDRVGAAKDRAERSGYEPMSHA